MPAFFAIFVQVLYNVISTIFIGHSVGPLGIAGLSIAFPLQMMTMGLGMMVGVGGASLISRQLGADDKLGAERTLGNGFSIGALVYLILTVIILPFMDFWLGLIGASEDVLPYARDYLVFIIGGSLFSIFSMALFSFARAEGNARVGMVAMILGATFSIALSAVFIIVLGMGVKGAGLATMIAQGISMAYLLSYYLAGSSYLTLSFSNFRPDFKIIRAMLSIGVAAFTQTIAASLAMMLVINMVVAYGGDITLSAFGIIQRLMMFAPLPGMAIGQGAQPILGYNYGAKRYHHLLKTITIAGISSTVLSILIFLAFYISPQPFIKVFTNDPEVIASGTHIARLMFLSMPLMGFVHLGTQFFQAIGKAIPAFTVAIVRPVIFLIPLALIMSRAWEIDGVFLSFPGSDILTLGLIIILIIPIIRQIKKAAASAKPDKQNTVNKSDTLVELTEPSINR